MEEIRFAITGATGFLGRRICRALIAKFGERCKILAFGRKETHICERVMSTNVDLLTQLSRAKQLLSEFKPNYLILLAGKTIYNPPKEQYEEYVKINTEIPYELAQLAYELNARVCYTSTDLVFTRHGPHNVDSTPSPTTIYGESKLNAEKLLLGKSLVVRLSVSYGLGGGFFQIMYDALKRGETLELFNDEYRSFCLGTEVASMIIELLLKDSLDLNKVWHIAGPAQASRYDFGLALAEVGGFDTQLIKSVSSKAIVKDVPRPENVCLLSSVTYQAIDFQPLAVKEGVRKALEEGVL